jgi:hypothetical protein
VPGFGQPEAVVATPSMRNQNQARLAAFLTLLAVLSAAGCGSLSTSRAAAAPARHPPEGICPPPDSAAAARATPCITVDPQKLQESNHEFQQRLPAAPALVAAAAPVQQRARRDLEHLTPAQRAAQSEVKAALIAAGLPAGGIYLQARYARMTAAGARVNVILFGAFTALSGPAACVYGTVATANVVVNIGGIIADGGCLPGPGGH